MNIRDYVYDLFTNDSYLNGLALNEDSIFNTNDRDTPQVRPFMVTRWGITSVGLDVVHERTVQIWIHDAPSDYHTIDLGLQRVRELLTQQYGVDTGANNGWVLQIEWAGDSEDLSDDIQNTITRYATFNVVGSAV